ncbi:hypothetical protein ACFLYO_06975 [Chloroflexota bacterium]
MSIGDLFTDVQNIADEYTARVVEEATKPYRDALQQIVDMALDEDSDGSIICVYCNRSPEQGHKPRCPAVVAAKALLKEENQPNNE